MYNHGASFLSELCMEEVLCPGCGATLQEHVELLCHVHYQTNAIEHAALYEHTRE